MIDSVRLQFDNKSHVTTNLHMFLDIKWGKQYTQNTHIHCTQQTQYIL